MVAQGELRRVQPWAVEGREYDGEHPVLVVGRGATVDGGGILVIPTKSIDEASGMNWEVEIDGTDSCALVDGLRTVPVSNLGRRRPGLALPADLRQVQYVADWLLSRGDRWNEDKFVRGSVYNLADSSAFPSSDEALVLRYNRRNDMAMVMRVSRSQPGLDRLAFPILSCPALAGHSLLPSYMCSVSAGVRLGGCVGTVSDSELERAVELLLEVVAPRAPAATP